jgi:hypothetical protein
MESLPVDEHLNVAEDVLPGIGSGLVVACRLTLHSLMAVV